MRSPGGAARWPPPPSGRGRERGRAAGRRPSEAAGRAGRGDGDAPARQQSLPCPRWNAEAGYSEPCTPGPAGVLADGALRWRQRHPQAQYPPPDQNVARQKRGGPSDGCLLFHELAGLDPFARLPDSDASSWNGRLVPSDGGWCGADAGRPQQGRGGDTALAVGSPRRATDPREPKRPTGPKSTPTRGA